MSPSNHFMQPGISSAWAKRAQFSPALLRVAWSLLFAAFFFKRSTRLAYPVHISGIIHAQAVSGVILQKQELDSIRAHPLPFSKPRVSPQGVSPERKGCNNPGTERATLARRDHRMVPLLCRREKESEAGWDVAACPPVAADSAPRLPGTDPEPNSDVTPTLVMQEGASQEM